MAVRHLSPMSAGTRQKFIDFIINTHLQLNRDVWWNQETPPQIVIDFRKWVREQEAIMRSCLEAMNCNELRAEFERCHERPKMLSFFKAVVKEEDREQELERAQQYFRSVAQKARRSQQSRHRPDIDAVVADITQRNPKLRGKQAYRQLLAGWTLPNEQLVRVSKDELTEASFLRRYWRKILRH